MVNNSIMIHVRIDEQVKTEATERLAAMGLFVFDGVDRRGSWRVRF